MKRIFLVAVALLGVYACAKSGAPDQQGNAFDTLSRRQKDSIIGTMPIPGASKIGDAQKAADKINEQGQVFDTVH